MPEDADDEGAAGLPPHPLDRVWFHPSELRAYMAARSPRSRRVDWGVAAIAALLGAAVTVGVLAATGTLGGDSTRISATDVTGVAGLAGEGAARAVAAAGPGIVAVRVGGGALAAPTTGSGVVIGRSDVLTSASLIAAGGPVTIATAAGRVVSAMVAGSDPDTDLALLRVDGGQLEAAPIGSADGLAVGDTVIALGVAGGEHRWASRGVVSALDRVVTTFSGRVMVGFVETDIAPSAAVAGGGLLDASGAVVGILSGAAPGMAYPIDDAREIAKELATNGRAPHGWLGVEATDAPDHAGGGARITAVAPGGPAARAGLAPGDVIVNVGDVQVSDMADLVVAVAQRRPGDPVSLTLWRATARLHRSVTLGDRDGDEHPVAATSSAG